MQSRLYGKISSLISSAASVNGKSLAEQLKDETCKLIADKIPEMTDNITTAIINELQEKIDSEKFSDDFVNVLQNKLLDDPKTSDPFLNKFSGLFDKIMERVINNYENPNIIPYKSIIGILKDIMSKEPIFTNVSGEAFNKFVDEEINKFKTKNDGKYRGDNIPYEPIIETIRSALPSNMMGKDDFDKRVKQALNQYKQNAPIASEKNVNQYPNAPVEAVAVPVNAKTPDENLPVDETVPVVPVVHVDPYANASAPVAVAVPVPNTLRGGRKKRTRKLSYKRKSRQNINKRARRLTKRNLLL